MKTLTEFSTLTLRKAADARAAAGGSRPAAPVSEAPPPAEVQESKAAPSPAEPTDSPDGAGASSPDAAEPSESQEVASGEGSEAAASEPAAPAPAAPADPAIDAVAAALSVQPDRAARLLEALDIIGNGIDQ